MFTLIDDNVGYDPYNSATSSRAADVIPWQETVELHSEHDANLSLAIADYRHAKAAWDRKYGHEVARPMFHVKQAE